MPDEYCDPPTGDRCTRNWGGHHFVFTGEITEEYERTKDTAQYMMEYDAFFGEERQVPNPFCGQTSVITRRFKVYECSRNGCGQKSYREI